MGDVLVVGEIGDNAVAADAGAAYVYRFEATTGTWIEEQKLTQSTVVPGGQLGTSVAIDGNFIVAGAAQDDAGAPQSGSVSVFEYDGISWDGGFKLPHSASLGQNFGWSADIDGNVIVAGAPHDVTFGNGAGWANVYRYDGTAWNLEQTLQPGDGVTFDTFGQSVAVQGNTIVVGAPNNDAVAFESGAAYVYRYSAGAWVQEAKLIDAAGAFGDDFGVSVDVSGTVAFVGSIFDDDVGGNAGSAFVFRDLGGGVWTQEAQLLAFDADNGDWYGNDVSVSGDLAVVGAERNGSGAAYTYRNSGTDWVLVQKLVASVPSPDDTLGSSVSVDGSRVAAGASFYGGVVGKGGRAFVYEVPRLALSVNLTSAVPGDLLTLTTCGGMPVGPVGHAVVEIASVPVFLLLSSGVFDAAGLYSSSVVVPPGAIGGISIDFQSGGFFGAGLIGLSNRVAVGFP